MARCGIVVDLNRCVGCMTCVVACKEENLTRPGVSWIQILQLEDPGSDGIVYIRRGCVHCDAPLCVTACPNTAVYRRKDGVVLVDRERCAGCGECVQACPYGAIVLNPDAEYFAGGMLPCLETSGTHRIHPVGTASMCTLCFHLIDVGREPACVAGCPSRALLFGDLDDPESAVSWKRQFSQPLGAFVLSQPKVTYLIPNAVEQRMAEGAEHNL